MSADLLDSYLVFPVSRAESSEQSCFVALPWDLLNASFEGPQRHYPAHTGKAQQALSKTWVCSPQGHHQHLPWTLTAGISPFVCESLLLWVLLHCSGVRAWMSASSPSQLLLTACIPVRAAEQLPFPGRDWALVLPCRVWAAPLLCWLQCPWHCLFHGEPPGHQWFPWKTSWTPLLSGFILSHPAFPSHQRSHSFRSSCLGQKPGFWLRKINLNGCSSGFNDPC